MEEPGVRSMSEEEVSERAARARDAQLLWRAYTLSQRVACLRALWKRLEPDRDRLCAVLCEETGKPLAEAETLEWAWAELALKHLTRSAHRVLQDQAARRPWPMITKRAYVRYVPRGLVGIITPRSLPFLIPFTDAAAAILAGNAVLWKPSPWAARTAMFLADRIKSAGVLPEGLLQVCLGDARAGRHVLERSDMVVFTGRPESGREVAAHAGLRLIPAVLELGGKQAMIVAKDAALGRAARAAVWGAFSGGGRTRVGVQRVFVEKQAYAAFCEEVSRHAAGLRVSCAGGYDADIGPFSLPASLEALERCLEDARRLGGRVVGGEVVDRAKLLVSPAVVLDATPRMAVLSREVFAPVLAVAPVGGVEEAVRLVNESAACLAVGVWTRDVERGEALGPLLETGLLGVNQTADHFPLGSLPFGGRKGSGLGRRHGDEGLRMFCHAQSVLVHEWPADALDPWWFPYSRLKARLMAWLARLS